MWRGSKDQSTRRLGWRAVGPRQLLAAPIPPLGAAPVHGHHHPRARDRVRSLSRDSGAHAIVVSAHSQGAIIAFACVEQLASSGMRRSAGAQGSACSPTANCSTPLPLAVPVGLQPRSRSASSMPQLERPVDQPVPHHGSRLGHPVRALAKPTRRDTSRSRTGLQLDTGATSRPKTLNHGDYWYSRRVPAALERLAGD